MGALSGTLRQCLLQIPDQLAQWAAFMNTAGIASPKRQRVQARQRLGDEPLQQLFDLLAHAWTWHQAQAKTRLRTLALDSWV